MSWYHALRKPPCERESREPAVSGRSESDLREDAERILRAAIEATDAERLVESCLRRRFEDSARPRRVRMAGFGVAASSMARGVVSVLGDGIREGVLVVPAGQAAEAPVPGGAVDIFEGGLGLPDPGGAAGAAAIRQLALQLSADDLLIGLVSGGGSSLLTLPPEGMPLEDVREVIRMLREAGAAGDEIARVATHLDALKGGRLAAAAAPARVLALVLCDRPEEDRDAVASGPFAPPRSTFRDAVEVLRRYELWSCVPLAVRGYLDRGRCGEIGGPAREGDACFGRVEALTVGSGHTAAGAACALASDRGYEAQVLTTGLAGPAREAGAFLAEAARTLVARRGAGQGPSCVISAGAPERSCRGSGPGGPALELALAAALEMDPARPALLVSMSSSGLDGEGGAAGAVVTSDTLLRAHEAGFDCARALERGEAHEVFDALDDVIVSGPTGTDVGAVQVLLLP